MHKCRSFADTRRQKRDGGKSKGLVQPRFLGISEGSLGGVMYSVLVRSMS